MRHLTFLLLLLVAQMMVGGCDSYDDGRLEMKQYEGKHYEICTPEDMFLVKKNLEEKKKTEKINVKRKFLILLQRKKIKKHES